MHRLRLLLVLLLAGCTPMQWLRPETSAAQLERDAAQCQQDAWREAQWRAFMYRPFGHTLLTDGRGRRFLWPHPALGDPYGDQFMEESRLAHFCMRAKGYELVPVEPKK